MPEKTKTGQDLILLSDGSVNPQSKVGYGAYLLISAAEVPLEEFPPQIKIRRFAPTTSTQLELQALLWALDAIAHTDCTLRICTDSQNIVGLPQRREQLEQNDYCTKSGRRLSNAALYQEFYRRTDQFDCEFVKLAGHLPAKQKTENDRLFSLVDKASRHALRDSTD